MQCIGYKKNLVLEALLNLLNDNKLKLKVGICNALILLFKATFPICFTICDDLSDKWTGKRFPLDLRFVKILKLVHI